MTRQFHSQYTAKTKNKKKLIQKDTCTSMFITALFIIAKEWKWLVSIKDVCIKKMVHTYNGILAIKKNFAICNNRDRAKEHYAKWNKSDRER